MAVSEHTPCHSTLPEYAIISKRKQLPAVSGRVLLCYHQLQLFLPLQISLLEVSNTLWT